MGTKHRPWLNMIAPVVLGLILLLGWVLTTALSNIPRYRLPTPAMVLDELYIGLISEADMWSFIGNTLSEALIGCLVGFCLALPLAVVIYRSEVFSAAILPFLGATQAIPAIALAPLLVLWIGYGLGAIVALCTLMVFFPILVSSVVGFRHIDRDILNAAEVDGAGPMSMLFEMEIPLALHSILAGVRNGFTLSITGAVVGEMVMGGSGLGSLITIQHSSYNTAGMFATIIVLALLAAIIYSIVSVFERRWSNLIAPLPKGKS